MVEILDKIKKLKDEYDSRVREMERIKGSVATLEKQKQDVEERMRKEGINSYEELQEKVKELESRLESDLSKVEKELA